MARLVTRFLEAPAAVHTQVHGADRRARATLTAVLAAPCQRRRPVAAPVAAFQAMRKLDGVDHGERDARKNMVQSVKKDPDILAMGNTPFVDPGWQAPQHSVARAQDCTSANRQQKEGVIASAVAAATAAATERLLLALQHLALLLSPQAWLPGQRQR